ncbi:sigma-70 family RNA polymerase sigma factor [Synechococcus sp. RSCCF101]|uniref:sigma-70 family RNA polymerase sigma factor n=1 Tax=Synechococcus sp. RSCCF101 TaxID=2511069 RepID=UPI00124537AF|nr:sigma-70 family RNA polymerase sigma factor [Synechococcus sp. RSCCF101]QEY31837.1 sigma-70 family RNA polymerase sigma factor [Synechococcus sp. RSCCF101]
MHPKQVPLARPALRVVDGRQALRQRNCLVQHHLGLVGHVAGRLIARTDCPYDDLFQVGCLGLIKAAEGFEPGRGAAFSSYAIGKIRGEMLHYLRDRHHPLRSPWRQRDLHARGMRLAAEWAHQGRSPSEAELALALGCSREQWQEARQLHHCLQMRSLDQPLAAGSGQDAAAPTLMEQLPDPRSQADDPAAGERQESPGAGLLRQLLEQLDPLLRRLIEGRVVDGLSWSALGEELGMHPRLAHRRCDQLLAELRAQLQPTAPWRSAPPQPSAGH